MNHLYQYQTKAKIELDTEYPVASITSAIIRYKKPSGACGSWAATIGADTIIYKNGFASTDFNELGIYKLQPVITVVGGGEIPCTVVEIRIRESITCEE